MAPFDGDLYPIDVSTRWGVHLKHCAERAAIDLAHAKKLFEIELTKERQLSVASLEASQEQVNLLMTELEAANAWYRSTPFVVTVTATVTVAALLTSTVLIQSTVGAGQ